MVPKTAPVAALDTYVGDLAIQSKNYSETTKFYLQEYTRYVKEKHGYGLDEHLPKLKSRETDVYNDLREFVAYLDRTKLKTRLNSPGTVMQKIKAVKRFLEYSDVEISNTKFRLKLKIPRPIRTEKEPLEKTTIQHILTNCDDPRLRAYVLWLAAMGCRAMESIAVRWEYLDFESDPATATIPGEYTKTRKSLRRYMTQELVKALKVLQVYNYRRRNTVRLNKATGKYETIPIDPKFDKRDYVFLPYRHGKQGIHDDRNLDFSYNKLRLKFIALLKRLAYDPHKITFHSFRRFVKSTYSDLGHSDFGEWVLGHTGGINMRYYNSSEREKIALFKKLEGYITFLDVSALEAKGADIVSKVEEIKNQEIAQLKEVIMTLSDRVGDLEKKKERESIPVKVKHSTPREDLVT